MTDFEDQLRKALKREEPSPFFEARVVAAAQRDARSRSTILRWRWMSAIAAGVLVMTGVVFEHRRAEERERGEAAKAQLLLALKITQTKLEKIETKMDSRGAN
jgi:hypothetical protein